MKKLSTAALLVMGAALLGATVLSAPIASAAHNISATITGPLDGQGNVKVHEQGTANVNVTGGKVNVGTTPIAGDSFASSIIGGEGLPFFRCAAGPIIASTVVLSSTQGPARFVLKKDADCSTVPPSGGTEVMNIIVPADSALAIPLHDRIEVKEVEITCGSGGCRASFDLNGQAG
jgi:hypothetical protein